MQVTDGVYNEIRFGEEYWYEPRVKIKNSQSSNDWLYYYNDQLLSLSTNSSLFGDGNPTVGNCTSSEMDLQILQFKTDHDGKKANIPKMAEIDISVRICNSKKSSAWYEVGKYFIDTRQISQDEDGFDTLTIHGYDAMIKAEQNYPSTLDKEYPLLDTEMLAIIASAIGVEIDSRTLGIMTKKYKFPLPASYSCREVLSRIAASYGGNFIISELGKLRLVPLKISRPDLLVDESGNVMLIGGDSILV